jgi:glucan phosphorylase
MRAARDVHVVAAEAGSERAAELLPALRAAGHAAHAHVLPPAAASDAGDVERLRQEAALVAGAVRAALADGGVLLLADERAALAVPEMMRVLLDERRLGWDEAWARTRAATFSRLGSPKSEPRRPFWLVSFLQAEQPRLLEILYEVNRRHLDQAEALWPGDGERRRRLSLFREGEARRLRPGPLAVIGSSRADVATPWEGPAAGPLADLAVLRGKALRARPTPLFVRHWLAEGNPRLAELLALTLGEGWASDPATFPRLETLAFDPAFRGAFRGVRRANRERLAVRLRDTAGLEIDPEALVDVRLGSLAGHERPLLNVLGLVREHLRLTAGGWTPPAPRTLVLARVAEAAGAAGERLAVRLRDTAGLEIDPEALVDVRLGSLAGHERPLLNVLGLVREHLRLTAGGWTPPAPRTLVLARVAEAAGAAGERLVRLLRAVAQVVNRDERARGLRVVVLPACDEETARLLAAAADLSNQPGTAGSGAAGARALGLAANGAVTLGTRDGTVREIEEAVGAENLFLFGLGPLETHAWREGKVYRPQDVYALDPLVRLSLDALVGTRYVPAPGAFDWVRGELLDQQDPWLVLADLGSYLHRQDEALAEFADPRAFTEKAILTLARARRFWVDRLELEA